MILHVLGNSGNNLFVSRHKRMRNEQWCQSKPTIIRNDFNLPFTEDKNIHGYFFEHALLYMKPIRQRLVHGKITCDEEAVAILANISRSRIKVGLQYISLKSYFIEITCIYFLNIFMINYDDFFCLNLRINKFTPLTFEFIIELIIYLLYLK